MMEFLGLKDEDYLVGSPSWWAEEVRDSAIAALRDLPAHDPEEAHSSADLILLDALEGLGYSEVVKAYRKAKEKIGFHYA